MIDIYIPVIHLIIRNLDLLPKEMMRPNGSANSNVNKKTCMLTTIP